MTKFIPLLLANLRRKKVRTVLTFGSFVVALAIVGLSGGMATLAFIPSVLSFTMIVALTGLELVVAVLQAFVFAALATVYLNEVVNFGHGH